MKKIFLFCAALLSLTAFSACQDDTDPKADRPADNNFLNIPPLANYTFDLKKVGAVEFTCSQPGYGVATTPTYTMQFSLSPDFKWDSANDQYVYDDEKKMASIDLATFANFATTNTTISVPAETVAQAINAMLGYDKMEQFDGSRPLYSGKLYARVRSYFPDVNGERYDYYSIESNIVTLQEVKAYETVRLPGFIYLVGKPEGWVGPEESNAEHYNDWKLFEADDAIGSRIYSGTFMIADGEFQFRFYTALTGWIDDSWGAQKDDSPVDIAFDGDKYAGAIGGPGYRGSYQVPGWTANWVKMTVNLNSKEVTFEIVDAPAAQ